MGKRILVLDDSQELLAAVKNFLTQNGFSVVAGKDGSEGRLLAQEGAPDLVLADADMPGLDGHSLCRVLKKDPKTRSIPVIIMSGTMMEEKDIVAGLEGGADDYILKPFPMKVLLARIHAVLRRFDAVPAVAQKLKTRGITLDPGAREVKVGGKAVPLTRKEFDLLALFIEKAGRVLTPSFLLEAVWGYDLADYNDPHTVETHISRLRKKIGAERIENVPGCGYKFVP
ncbi:MAG: response regulator transcription factor [Elusimicrobia bacterium]|nr:response regulator transcription factor [Elusimicrobiota bacterium]